MKYRRQKWHLVHCVLPQGLATQHIGEIWPMPREAMNPRTMREIPRRSAHLFKTSIRKYEERTEDLKGLPRLRVGGGDGQPPCSFEAMCPRTTRHSHPRSA